MIQRILLFSAAVVQLSACTGATDTHGPPAAIRVARAPIVPVEAGTLALDSVAVRVVDARGRGVPGVAVAWAADEVGTAAVNPSATTTDGDGIARAELRAGTAARTGKVSATATIAGMPVRAEIDVTVVAGHAVSLQAVTSVTMGTSATRAITLVALDAYGNAASMAALEWSSTAPRVADVGPGGVVTSNQLIGEATITARVGAATHAIDIWVVPGYMESCERNTGEVCGRWVLQTDHYRVWWSDDVTSRVDVVRFSDSQVDFRRTDLSGNQNFNARYVGTKSGQEAAGAVTWTQNGVSWSGNWNARW